MGPSDVDLDSSDGFGINVAESSSDAFGWCQDRLMTAQFVLSEVGPTGV